MSPSQPKTCHRGNTDTLRSACLAGFQEVLPYHILRLHHLDRSFLILDGVVGTPGKTAPHPSAWFVSSLGFQEVNRCVCLLETVAILSVLQTRYISGKDFLILQAYLCGQKSNQISRAVVRQLCRGRQAWLHLALT